MTMRDALGLTIEEVSRLNQKELKEVIQVMNKSINQRLRRLDRASVQYSPAAEGLKESGGNLTTRGRTLNQLRAEYVRGKRFLEAQTSTVTGYRHNEQEVINRLSGMAGKKVKLDIKDQKRLWQLYNRYMEQHPSEMFARGGSDRVQQQIYSLVIEGKSNLSITRRLNKLYRETYESNAREELNNEQLYNGAGRFFEVT